MSGALHPPLDVEADLPQIRGDGTPAAHWRASVALAKVACVDVDELLGDATRLVVVAPHPDDETLGTGALIAACAARGLPIQVLSLTRGEASHPESTAWTPSTLGVARLAEQREALRRLGASGALVEEAGLPDGAVAAAEGRAADFLAQRISPSDLVLVTWRSDGHPDHEAAGRAAAAACARQGARLIEYPVWAWHWASPQDERLPWARMRRLRPDPGAVSAKADALLAFRSQLEPDGGRAPILPSHVLERFDHAPETFIVPSTAGRQDASGGAAPRGRGSAARAAG